MGLTNKESEAEKAEEDHRVEVKVYMQKIKHLEYEQKMDNKKIALDGRAYERDEHTYHEDITE